MLVRDIFISPVFMLALDSELDGPSAEAFLLLETRFGARPSALRRSGRRQYQSVNSPGQPTNRSVFECEGNERRIFEIFDNCSRSGGVYYFLPKPGCRRQGKYGFESNYWLYLMRAALFGTLVNFSFHRSRNIAVWFGSSHIYRPDFHPNEPDIFMAHRIQECVVV